jgi:polysaccharide biosynthesis protein PelC
MDEGKRRQPTKGIIRWCAMMLLCIACASGRSYHDAKMDFASIHTVAVLPLTNLSRDGLAGDRVRDVLANLLLSTGSLYVLPQGELAKGIMRAGVANPSTPSKDEVIALGKALGADAVIGGTLKEYGELRSGNTVSNAISLSLMMYETTTGMVVWSADSTKGGVSFADRLLGGGGAPMNSVTEDACRELLGKLFK